MRQDQKDRLPWDDADWLETATAWMHAQLTSHNIQSTGPMEILHQRPWSTFARMPTDNGIVHFKAPAPAFKYEAALTQALAHWWPEGTVPILGVDLDRGWLLSADAGITLRSISRAPDQIEHWPKILPFYVELQKKMADRVPDLLALGLPDRRLSGLPQQYDRLLESTEYLLIGQDDGLTDEEYQQLLALRPRFTAMCENLAAYNLPESLTHEEVHENNVLFGDGRYVLTDWSDCSISHPFFSMLVTVRTLAYWLKLDENGPEVTRARDAYLESWTTFETRDNLLDALDIANRLARVNRALSWHQGQEGLPAKYKDQYADYVPGWLQDFLEIEAPD